MIKKLGTHRGYDLFYQETTDFKGVYSVPGIGAYLGQTFAEAKATINAMLDEQPEDDVEFDVDEAGRLFDER